MILPGGFFKNVFFTGDGHMSIVDTAYKIVLGSSGGITAMAARMGKSEKVLGNKLNPNCDTHHLNIEEMEMIVGFADTDEVAKYFCAQRDGVFVRSHQLDCVSDQELLDLFLERESRYGKFSGRVREALADGGIDEREYKELMRLFDDVSEAREQIRARLKALHEQTMDRAVRLSSIKSVK